MHSRGLSLSKIIGPPEIRIVLFCAILKDWNGSLTSLTKVIWAIGPKFSLLSSSKSFTSGPNILNSSFSMFKPVMASPFALHLASTRFNKSFIQENGRTCKFSIFSPLWAFHLKLKTTFKLIGKN